jgi:hypothetical protein
MSIQISGCTVIDNSRNIVNGVNLTASGTIAGGIVATQAEAEAGTNNDQIMTPLKVKQFFNKQPPPLAQDFGGGLLICKNSTIAWIVAPSSSEVSRTWYLRGDANTRAQQVSGCTGWFVPTISQLQNPGWTCRAYWDTYANQSSYWSSTDLNVTHGCLVFFNNGTPYAALKDQTTFRFVRSFRCVTY